MAIKQSFAHQLIAVQVPFVARHIWMHAATGGWDSSSFKSQ